MLLDLTTRPQPASAAPAATTIRPAPSWSVLLPFFNERDCVAATIESLGAQTVPVRLILIDNGSTDGSGAIARAACDRLGLDYLLLTETRPGKVQALQTGLAWVRTPHVATCDADTFYPSTYLAAAQALLAQDGCVVAGAYWSQPGDDAETRARAGRKMLATARALPRQCHTGGAGQCFRTDVLLRAGGFDPKRWGYVLEDHEIIHRVMRHGTMRYAIDLWCAPSPRDRDRPSIRWTLVERLAYSALAPIAGDWFFYRFLARRLAARHLLSRSIRERAFQDIELPHAPIAARTLRAASHPVCG